jgi:hypothetical protein
MWIGSAFLYEKTKQRDGLQDQILNVIDCILAKPQEQLTYVYTQSTRVVVKRPLNSLMRLFCIDGLISECHPKTFDRNTRATEWREGLERIGPNGAEILEEILTNIDGIASVYIESYEIHITLEPGWQWTADVQEYIAEVMLAALRSRPFPEEAPQPLSPDDINPQFRVRHASR